MSLHETPNANRLHIALFGKRNSGKSSLINALTGQNVALVSDVPGTTTDPVYKNMEIHPIGPCVLIDTAGFDDVGELGEMRVEHTKKVLGKTDIALVLFSGINISEEIEWVETLKEHNIPFIPLISKADIIEDIEIIKKAVEQELKKEVLCVSINNKDNINLIKNKIIEVFPDFFEFKSITNHLASESDVVLLVMPQDIQAPKGRLILPQVQTIRDLLDLKCIVISITTDKLENALNALKEPPKLIITDSQVFKEVYDKKPKESILTSFSILFARYKGDIHEYVKGANYIDSLKETDNVLIAEACTHNPLDGDIGRIKIPNMLRKRIGEKLKIDIVCGSDFPDDLSKYKLVIHCGGCMFNRKHVLNRINTAVKQNVAITNYGVALAKMTGILDKVEIA